MKNAKHESFISVVLNPKTGMRTACIWYAERGESLNTVYYLTDASLKRIERICEKRYVFIDSGLIVTLFRKGNDYA